MSEKLRLFEQQTPETISNNNAELYKNNNEIIKESSEALNKNIEQIRKEVEKHSDGSGEKTKRAEHFKNNVEKSEHRHYITKKIKSDKYKETLKEIRTQLSKPNQVFSKFIHQPIIESTSEIGAKTIARPSGILSGGVVGLFGSILILFYAKNIGFEIPASAYVVLFLIGYLLGITIEFTYKLILKNHKKRNSLSYK
jgi:hypothetical protein